MKLTNAKITGFFSMPSPALAEHNPTAYNNAMREMPAGAGTCAHCGTGIRHHVVCVDESGAKFFIGTTCAEKVGLNREQVRRRMTDEQVAARNKRNAERQAAYESREADKVAKNEAFHADRLEDDARIASGIVEAIGRDILEDVKENGWYGAAEVAECLLNGDLNNGGGYRMNSVSMYRLSDEAGKLMGRRNSKIYKQISASVEDAFSEDVVDYLENTPAQLGWTAKGFYS